MANDISVKELVLNHPQALVQLINANKTFCAWGRGTGKTTGVHGPRFVELSESMPGCQIGFITDTYERFHGPIISGLEGFITQELGLLENEDYVMFKKPPEHWKKPLYPIRKYDHVMMFATGVAVIGGSMKIEGSLNGQNLQALLGDEMKYVKEDRVNEARRAVRGALKRYGHLHQYRSEWFTTDKFGDEIFWYLNKRKLVDPKKVQATLKIAIHVEMLKQKLKAAANNANASFKFKKELSYYDTILTQLRKNLVYFSEASAKENMQFLGEQFFIDLEKDCKSKLEMKVAVHNEDPTEAEEKFYPTLSEQNYYNLAYDYDPNSPLIIIMDYQYRLIPIVVCQVSKLPDWHEPTLNFIDCIDSEIDMFDALDKFHNTYSNHPGKNVMYLYDHTAVGKKPDGKPFNQSVISRLKDYHKWNVTDIHMGMAPDHAAKHDNTKQYLVSMGAPTMRIRINKIKCDYLIKSMNFSEAIIKMSKTQKNKTTETDINFPPRLSTHYSDCFDQGVRAIIELNLISITNDRIPITIR